MGEHFETVVWRSGKVDTNGDLVTDEALEQMAASLQQPPGVGVSSNFDFRRVVGHVNRAWVDGHDLYVDTTFDDLHIAELLLQGKAAIRPGFAIEKMRWDDGHELVVIEQVGQVHISVLTNPMPLPGE